MPRFAANLSMMFTEHAFLDRFAAAATAGFPGVEYLFPYEYAAEDIREALDGAGLAQALFNCPPGDWEAGERGMASVPGRGAEFRESIERALSYAEVLKPERIHIMAGNAGGPGAQAAYIDSLAWAAERAPDQIFVVEPINSRDMPGYFLNRSDQAIAILDTVGAPNLMLQFDLYHAQIMEGDLTRRLERLIDRIGHVQIASVPDRHEPDTGELDMTYMFAALDRLGYAGWVGAEYRPIGRTEDGLGWLQRATVG
ncbi:MAG: 2-oxo-tetronate isomerase [Pseudomonadota bacterium]